MTVIATEHPVKAKIAARMATDAEVSHYHANGWVKMERLIEPDVAAAMLERAKHEILDSKADGVRSHERAVWRDVYNIGRDEGVEPFAGLVRSPVIGINAHRFIRRETPIALHADMLAVKMPGGKGGSGFTGWHQDFPNFPLDRVGLLTFWIALDDLTPEQGTMRFLSGSHREGPLGKRNLEIDERGLLDDLPYLEKDYPISPPLALKAGDCTVHNAMTIHMAPANVTDRPRWTYLMSYYPADACWTGAPHHIFNEAAGLQPLQPIRSRKFPIVYGA